MSVPCSSSPSVTHIISLLPISTPNEDGQTRLYYDLKHSSPSGAAASEEDLWRWVSAVAKPLRSGLWAWTNNTKRFDSAERDALDTVRRAKPKAQGTLDRGTVWWEICEDALTFGDPRRGDKVPRMYGLQNPCLVICPEARRGHRVITTGNASLLCTPRKDFRHLHSLFSRDRSADVVYPAESWCIDEFFGVTIADPTGGDDDSWELLGRESTSTGLVDVDALQWPELDDEMNRLKAQHSDLAELSVKACDLVTFRRLSNFLSLIDD